MTRPTATPAVGDWHGSLEAALDDDHFETLVQRSRPRVYRIIHALVWDADAAATLTQECFLKAYRGRDGFRGDARPDTWLVSIALNVARDHLKNRRQSFWRRLVRANDTTAAVETRRDPAPSAERAVIAREAVGRVFAAVRELSHNQREAFVLRFVEEMSLDEIARTLGISEGTVKTHLHRAVGAVRRRLQEES